MKIWKVMHSTIVCYMFWGALALSATPRTPEIFVQGARLRGANGLIFDRHDTLWIASNAQSVITAMDPETGEILKTFGYEQGVVTPDDLIFGPDDMLYFTSYFSGTISRLTRDGKVQKIAQVPGANPITISTDGRLFTAGFHFSNGLYELDYAGKKAPRPIVSNDANFMLNGMDFGPDGRLYAPRPLSSDIVRIDVNSGTWTTVVNLGGAGLAAVKFNSHGQLYALKWNNLGQNSSVMRPDEIIRVDTQTGKYEVMATVPPGPDNLAFDSHDRLYITGDFDGSITEVLNDGSMRIVSPGGMIAPGGIAILGESVFVADAMSLRQFNRQTGEPTGMQYGYDFSALHSPMTVAPDGDNLLLTSWFDNTVQIWNPQTNTSVETYEDFAVPLNAIRFQGDLIVAELGTNQVVRVNGVNPAERHTLCANLTVPLGLAATEKSLWVGDWGSGTIWQVIADGKLLDQPIPVATGLSRPEGLAVAADGSLLVVETGTGKLLAIHAEDGTRQVLAEGLAVGAPGPQGFPPAWLFNGVTRDSSGAIYITGDVANVIYRVIP